MNAEKEVYTCGDDQQNKAYELELIELIVAKTLMFTSSSDICYRL